MPPATEATPPRAPRPPPPAESLKSPFERLRDGIAGIFFARQPTTQDLPPPNLQPTTHAAAAPAAAPLREAALAGPPADARSDQEQALRQLKRRLYSRATALQAAEAGGGDPAAAAQLRTEVGALEAEYRRQKAALH